MTKPRTDALKAKNRFYKQTYRGKVRRIIQGIKSQPCMDCGIQYPFYVMQFDHRPDEEKTFNIGPSVGSYSLETILEEIAKCDVVCANCHAFRTYDRKKWDK